MSDLLTPRDYQEECIADFFRRAAAGGSRIPHVLATGLGKTVIFAHIIARWLAEHPGQRAMVLVHTDELVQQAFRKIREVAPHLSVGIVKAARNEVTARCIVASVQSLRSAKRRAQIRRLGLLIIDECHHATAKTYRDVIEHFEDALVAGFTATLARGDKAKLSEIWETDPPPFTRGISFGIRRGYLLDVRGKRIVVPEMDLARVGKRGGDFAEGSLAEEMERSLAPEIIAARCADLAGDRKGLVFWPTVELAGHGAEAFAAEGLPSAVVHGGLGQLERRLILKRLASGEILWVHNCAVLTEGFDDPTISCVVIARPTRSAPLYQQMVGRGLRPDLTLPAAARGDCLVLDVVGASRSHDLRSLVDLSEKKEEIGEIEMDEELSLLALEEMLEEQAREGEGGPGFEAPYVGETESVDFDPLNRTGIGAWLTTFDGTYFLPVGRRAYVLLVPSEEPGRWDVAWLPKDSKHWGHLCQTSYATRFTGSRYCVCPPEQRHEGERGGLTEHVGLSLEMACSWAEEVMEKIGGKLALRVGAAAAPWREQSPNITLLRKAWDMRIPTKGLNKGELTDAVEILEASGRIDPVVAFMRAAQ
jgi:superfamily II DNA or RNA helicase